MITIAIEDFLKEHGIEPREPQGFRTYDDEYYEDYDKNWWDLVYKDDDDFDESLADDIRHGYK